jgi:hypothetical protein
LVSLAALEVACDEGVLTHLGRLDEAIRSGPQQERFLLLRVREALAIHLELLRRRPDALWPALHSHLAFVDSPAARRFGLWSQGPEMQAMSLVGRWLAERQALHPNTPWFKALTPATPWGGSVLAELRGIDAPVVRAVDADGVVVEAGGTTLRWRPALGSVSPATPFPSPKEVALRPRGGGLALEREGRLTWLLPPVWLIDGVASSADGRWLSCHASDMDLEEDAVFVFDVTTLQQRAAIPGSAQQLALSPNGAFVAFSSGDGVTTVHELATGRPTSVSSTLAPSSIVVSADGQRLAQVEDGVVRLYRPMQRRSPRAIAPRGLGPQFSRDGATLLLGQFIVDGRDGTVLMEHRHRRLAYLEGGPALDATRLTAERLCISEAFFTEILQIPAGSAAELPLHATLSDRIAWSGDGRVFAVVRDGRSTIHLASGTRSWSLDASGPLAAIALDTTGSQLVLLHESGDVELQPGGTRLRRLAGATAMAFLANDTALAVGDDRSTVVLGLDGTERWHSKDPFAANDARAAQVEWQSGLRAPSIAESLDLRFHHGLLIATHAGHEVVFPAMANEVLRSPAHAVVVNGLTVLSFEQGDR